MKRLLERLLGVGLEEQHMRGIVIYMDALRTIAIVPLNNELRAEEALTRIFGQHFAWARQVTSFDAECCNGDDGALVIEGRKKPYTWLCLLMTRLGNPTRAWHADGKPLFLDYDDVAIALAPTTC